MKPIIRLSVLAIYISLLAACGDNCESEKVGEQLLGEPSKRYVPYIDGEQITFVGETGQLLEFTVEVQRTTTDRNCVKYRCELTADPFQQTPCEYFETESIRNLLRSADGTIFVDMIVSIFNYEEETELFYDRFSITASEVGVIGQAEEITHVHFRDPIFNPNIQPIFNPFIRPDEVTLNGKTIDNVFHTNVGNEMLFFKPDVGLVGLNIGGDTLVVQ